MDPVRNPYSPGPGRVPRRWWPGTGDRRHGRGPAALLLGRERAQRDAHGAAGVGKTVLLNEFEQLAEAGGTFTSTSRSTSTGDLPVRLASAFRRVLLAMDARRRIGERVRRSLGILKAFSLRLPGGPEMSIDVDAVYGRRLRDLRPPTWPGCSWKAGRGGSRPRHGRPVTIDELHYVGSATLEALVMGLHRALSSACP